VQRGRASPELAVVLDVVMDEKRRVEELDGGRGGERVLDIAPECRAGGEAERGTQALPRPLQVVGCREADV
jgi:hypothetical protein